ncbi:MAG: pyridoxamine 5'-phosphate oxidase family protein [Actinobacteria bacterium]|nr:pyridoxamine 5'-phosphate oxidase family protein [Actinomycetota bacterium]
MGAAEFYEIIDHFDNCMLLTFTANGTPHARPMAIADRDGSVLWFISDRDSATIDEVVADDSAVVTVQSPQRWAAATGTATVVYDRDRIDDLWSTPMKAWFPDGPADPKLVAVKADLHDGEYWDISGGRLVKFAAGFAKSVVTDTEIDADEEGDHGRESL